MKVVRGTAIGKVDTAIETLFANDSPKPLAGRRAAVFTDNVGLPPTIDNAVAVLVYLVEGVWIVRLEELTTPQEWAHVYRALFGLPHVHVTTPGFVVLSLVDTVAALNTPEPLGALMLDELKSRGIPGPVLVRESPPRRTFLAVFDGYPEPECIEKLERSSVDIGPHRSNVILPTGFGRHTHEGRWWARAPQRDESLPLLSEVLSAAKAVL